MTSDMTPEGEVHNYHAVIHMDPPRLELFRSYDSRPVLDQPLDTPHPADAEPVLHAAGFHPQEEWRQHDPETEEATWSNWPVFRT